MVSRVVGVKREGERARALVNECGKDWEKQKT